MGTGTDVQAGGRGRTTAPERHARQDGRQPPHARSHGMSKGRRPVVASRRRQRQRRDVARPMGGACTMRLYLHDIKKFVKKKKKKRSKLNIKTILINCVNI